VIRSLCWHSLGRLDEAMQKGSLLEAGVFGDVRDADRTLTLRPTTGAGSRSAEEVRGSGSDHFSDRRRMRSPSMTASSARACLTRRITPVSAAQIEWQENADARRWPRFAIDRPRYVDGLSVRIVATSVASIVVVAMIEAMITRVAVVFVPAIAMVVVLCESS
jgi:hypothetical protein